MVKYIPLDQPIFTFRDNIHTLLKMACHTVIYVHPKMSIQIGMAMLAWDGLPVGSLPELFIVPSRHHLRFLPPMIIIMMIRSVYSPIDIVTESQTFNKPEVGT